MNEELNECRVVLCISFPAERLNMMLSNYNHQSCVCHQGEVGLPGPPGVDGEKVIHFFQSAHFTHFRFVYLFLILTIISV